MPSLETAGVSFCIYKTAIFFTSHSGYVKKVLEIIAKCLRRVLCSKFHTMSKFKEAIKALLSKHPDAKKELTKIILESQVKLGATAELKDGSKVYSDADKWAVGVPVFGYDESTDTKIEVADGTYELADGSSIVVEGGTVKEIVAKAEMAEETITEEQAAELVEKLGGALDQLETAKAELSAVKADNDKMKADMAELKKKMVALSKLPGAESVKFTADEPEKPLTAAQRIVKAMDATNN